MEVIAQSLDEILETLRPLTVEWKDETATRVIDRLREFPVKNVYTSHDVARLLDADFEDGILMCRLFLGFSKDYFVSVLRGIRGKNGIGIKSYHADRERFIADLLSTGILEAMAEEANRTPHWSDVLVERLRSGRGSAISGQRRGRSLEDFAENIIRAVFKSNFEARCTFQGPRGQQAKCDFAIPMRRNARILIELKGYGATGSKMSDILGDIHAIIAAKRRDTAFLFFTDGLSWKQRKSDLRKIVELQNTGDITRIYNFAMAKQFEEDLRTLKAEYKL
jgi:DpnII restriction endonuclease